MTTAPDSSNNWLSVFSRENLSLLTAAELRELDQILTAPRNLRDIIRPLPASVVRLMLDAVRAVKAEPQQAQGKHVLIEIVLRLPESIRANVIDALRNGYWKGPEDPALLATAAAKPTSAAGTAPRGR